MLKLDLEMAEEPEIKARTFAGSQKKQGHSLKKKKKKNKKQTSSASLAMLKTLTVWITKNCGKFLKRWEYQTT